MHVWAVGFGQVEVGHGVAFERVAVDVADLAYNRSPGVEFTGEDAVADWVFSGPFLIRERPVNDGDMVAAIVREVEVPAAIEQLAHGVKVTGGDLKNVGRL